MILVVAMIPTVLIFAPRDNVRDMWHSPLHTITRKRML